MLMKSLLGWNIHLFSCILEDMDWEMNLKIGKIIH